MPCPPLQPNMTRPPLQPNMTRPPLQPNMTRPPLQVYTWILELSNPDTREHALIELSKKREVLPDLAPMLWYSFGTLSALLQEIVMIYPVINPPSLTVRPCIHTL